MQKQNQKILVTGGAGYVGMLLLDQLLGKGYQVRVLDNLLHGQTCHLPLFANKNFEFIKGDIRSKKTVKDALKGIDWIIHLAAIVGFPACRANPKLAREVNVKGTLNINDLRGKNQPLIYASTGSVYGAIEGICTEKTPLNPTSLYGETKAIAEKEVLKKKNAVALRFATGFGNSVAPRFDLLVNDFVFQAVRNKQLIVFDKDFKRTFIHVRDIARSYVFTIENFNKMKNEAFNVGSEKMNFSKEDIALKIKEKVPYQLFFSGTGKDEDCRDYEVSYQKIRNVGFETQISMDDGIGELIRGFKSLPTSKDFFSQIL
jgi:nucleoside-diphosphate-sugar epimerase